MTKATKNEIRGLLFSLIIMVVWFEGGQGEVKGTCDRPTLGLEGVYRTNPVDLPHYLGKPPPPRPPPLPLPEPALPTPPPRGPPANSWLGRGGGGIGIHNRGVASPMVPHLSPATVGEPQWFSWLHQGWRFARVCQPSLWPGPLRVLYYLPSSHPHTPRLLL